MILHCGCSSTPASGALYQDAHYGKGNRVHNSTAKENPKTFRCTVCGHERTKPGAVEKAKQEQAGAEAKTKNSGRKLASGKK